MNQLTISCPQKPVVVLTIKQGLAVYQLPADNPPNHNLPVPPNMISPNQAQNSELDTIDLLAQYILAKS